MALPVHGTVYVQVDSVVVLFTLGSPTVAPPARDGHGDGSPRANEAPQSASAEHIACSFESTGSCYQPSSPPVHAASNPRAEKGRCTTRSEEPSVAQPVGAHRREDSDGLPNASAPRRLTPLTTQEMAGGFPVLSAASGSVASSPHGSATGVGSRSLVSAALTPVLSPKLREPADLEMDVRLLDMELPQVLLSCRGNTVEAAVGSWRDGTLTTLSPLAVQHASSVSGLATVLSRSPRTPPAGPADTGRRSGSGACSSPLPRLTLPASVQKRVVLPVHQVFAFADCMLLVDPALAVPLDCDPWVLRAQAVQDGPPRQGEGSGSTASSPGSLPLKNRSPRPQDLSTLDLLFVEPTPEELCESEAPAHRGEGAAHVMRVEATLPPPCRLPRSAGRESVVGTPSENSASLPISPGINGAGADDGTEPTLHSSGSVSTNLLSAGVGETLRERQLPRGQQQERAGRVLDRLKGMTSPSTRRKASPSAASPGAAAGSGGSAGRSCRAVQSLDLDRLFLTHTTPLHHPRPLAAHRSSLPAEAQGGGGAEGELEGPLAEVAGEAARSAELSRTSTHTAVFHEDVSTTHGVHAADVSRTSVGRTPPRARQRTPDSPELLAETAGDQRAGSHSVWRHGDAAGSADAAASPRRFVRHLAVPFRGDGCVVQVRMSVIFRPGKGPEPF